MEWFYADGTHRFIPWKVFCSIYDNDWLIDSTMYFIVGQANKYNVDPILTLDQPLYQKANKIQWKESENSKLKRIVLGLGGLHTCMSFLGCIGHFMSSTQRALDVLHIDAHWTSKGHMMPTGKWSSWSARNHLWKWYSCTYAVRFSHLKGISWLSYCFRCALCNNNFLFLWMSIARSVQCRREQKRSM